MNQEQKEFTIEDIDKLSKLAKLELSDKMKATLAKEIGEIVAYAQILTDNTPAEKSSFFSENSLREDEQSMESFADADALVASAKTTEGRFISVPKVIE